MEDVICNVTIMQGYQIQLAVDYGDATPTENINILGKILIKYDKIYFETQSISGLMCIM